MKIKNTNFLKNFIGLYNKKIIITGCAGQLGSCLAENFLKLGCTVIGIDIEKPKKRLKGKYFFYKSDVSNIKQNNEVFKIIFKRFNKIECLINNAGVAVFDNFMNRSEDEFDWVTNVNLKSYFYCIKNFYKFSDKKTKKSIINVSSIYSIISPDPKIYKRNDRKSSEIYGATKAGVNQITRYFAVHLADKNCRVNAISPGGIFNSQKPQNKAFIKKYSLRNPLNRMADTQEIVGAAIYLASKSSTYTNGHNLVVDGGMSSW